MKFRYADELKAKFEVRGHFYNLQLGITTCSCRSVLEIKRKRSPLVTEIPDVAVVMMNPGSSKPIDSNYLFPTYTSHRDYNSSQKEMVLTQPDSTQYQIMRLMLLSNWKFARIVNLSDLRNGNSSEFQKTLREVGSKIPHSLLHDDRRQELGTFITTQSGTIIGAWGSIPELRAAATVFLDRHPDTIYLPKEPYPDCSHASPMMKKHKMAWLSEMRRELMNRTK